MGRRGLLGLVTGVLLLVASTGTASAGPHDYTLLADLKLGNGMTVSWPHFDACQPVSWGVDPASGSPQAVASLTAMAQKALDEVAASTPWRFRQVALPAGVSAAIPTWSPNGPRAIIIGWRTGTIRGSENAWGIGGPYEFSVRSDGSNLHSNSAYAIESTLVPANMQYTVLAHELGHALGLGHTVTSTQLMNGAGAQLTALDWADGDLAGLAFLAGRDGCAAPPAP